MYIQWLDSEINAAQANCHTALTEPWLAMASMTNNDTWNSHGLMVTDGRRFLHSFQLFFLTLLIELWLSEWKFVN